MVPFRTQRSVEITFFVKDASRVLTIINRGWNKDLDNMDEILIIGTSSEHIHLTKNSRVALISGLVSSKTFESDGP